MLTCDWNEDRDRWRQIVNAAKPTNGGVLFRERKITEDALISLDLMKQHKFQLDLENSVTKTGQEEIAVKMTEQD